MSTSRIRVKMCGMTLKEDIQYAVQLGVDAIGLIFYAKSSRHITIEQAKQILEGLPPFVEVVAVLVNEDAYFVKELIKTLPIQLLQFHGDESADFCQQFNKPYIKAIHPKSSEHIRQRINEYANAQALLLDTASDTNRGGTGLTFDWSIIPADLPKAFILAGGLNEFNIAEAIHASNPYAVDVCSGIEAMPGVKDHIKMSRFMKALRGNK